MPGYFAPKFVKEGAIPVGPIILKQCHITGNHNTVKLQWLEHLWDYENYFETGVVRANEG